MDKVIKVVGRCNRIIKTRLIISSSIAIFSSAYTPETGLPEEQKDYYETLQQINSITADSDLINMTSNFGRHVDNHVDTFHNINS